MEMAGGPATIVALLRSCTEKKDLQRGSTIHTHIIKKGLLKEDIVIGNTLVNMYAKCGALPTAKDVFDVLLVRNVVSWNVLMAGYAKYGQGRDVLNLFRQMQHEGLSPNAITILCALKACGSIDAISKGLQLHSSMVNDELLEKDAAVANALLDMYAKCGLFERAQEAFDMLPARNEISWNTLISGYVQHGLDNEALCCYEKMQSTGLSPDAFTYSCILKACGSMGTASKGQEIHAFLIKFGLLGNDIVLGTTLVDMYAKCNLLAKAQTMFERLPGRSLVSWNALLTGYSQHGYGEQVLNCYEYMKFEGVFPDSVTFVCLLKACGSIGDLERGQDLHAQLLEEGYLKKDTSIGGALVDMYSKCGVLDKAQEVFDKLSVHDVVSWGALLAGYAQHGYADEALHILVQMQDDGVCPNIVTFVCALKACSTNKASYKGLEIHAEIVIKGFSVDEVVVGTALVDMYASCGMLEEAQQVFESLSFRDVIAWNALIAMYAHDEEALHCYKQMHHEGICPNFVTFLATLKVCGCLGAAYKGQEMYIDIVSCGLVEEELVVGTALVDMYANCGMVVEAHQVFKMIVIHSIVTWNALLSGYSQLGEAEAVFSLLDSMTKQGQGPDHVTFTMVLNTCTHSGLVDVGQLCLEKMKMNYAITPSLEHYSCMVDLFGRTGNLENALIVIKEMPIFANPTAWHTLQSASQRWGNVNVARFAFQHAAHLDQLDGAAYVLWSNMYGAGALETLLGNGHV